LACASAATVILRGRRKR